MIMWKLKDYLDEQGITPYKLAQQTGEKLSQNAVYRLAGPDVSRFDRESLDVLIEALRELTGKAVKVSDLLEYQEG